MCVLQAAAVFQGGRDERRSHVRAPREHGLVIRAAKLIGGADSERPDEVFQVAAVGPAALRVLLAGEPDVLLRDSRKRLGGACGRLSRDRYCQHFPVRIAHPPWPLLYAIIQFITCTLPRPEGVCNNSVTARGPVEARRSCPR